ncbi:GGDEF domain-containing protein [Pseudodesulfovibrio portus]|uniref:diguanylate cyclase n=1 Tax=Pseudodesulfovibrio portus TaxID=231439 RepID=A0ABN6RT29_9BACT|nr:GGDEF domain-containing protein [Pseudodesulfovibrio portus]BDQ34239.1 GGDEF domain-containing protein [Pseudodesulfovibrio portus]
MTGSARTKELFRLMKESGIDDDPDWMAVVLFIRNLLPRLTIYTDEKKAEIQQEIREQLLAGDFSEKRFETILAMLEMYIMQNIGTLELEAALTSEKRSASQLVNEMAVIISSMQGVNERQADRLGTFEEDTVDIIQSGSKRSMIVSGVRGMFQELIQEFETEASELNAKASYFERTANFDPLLSELYNRRAFDNYIEEAVKGRKQGDPPLSMMMIDVDHFKKVNDTYGHQTGDDVLRALARIISAHASLYAGFAARYGGEELVLVMKNMNLDTAAIKAEAIRYDVQNYGFRARENGRFSDDTLQFTVSIGVAQWQEGWSASKLIDAADTALYQAKNSGRNRVCSAKDQ